MSHLLGGSLAAARRLGRALWTVSGSQLKELCVDAGLQQPSPRVTLCSVCTGLSERCGARRACPAPWLRCWCKSLDCRRPTDTRTCCLPDSSVTQYVVLPGRASVPGTSAALTRVPAAGTREAFSPHSRLQCAQHRARCWLCSTSQWPLPASKAQQSSMQQRT